MIRRALACAILTAACVSAAAQERVTVGTTRTVSSGALFLAAAQGYFKAEGLDVEMTAYQSPQDVVEALAGNATDFGLADFTPAAFNLAGQGTIKAIAAQAREKRGYEGNEIIASNAAYAGGLRKPGDLAGKAFAISDLGSIYHYQLGQIARAKGFALSGITLKVVGSLDAVGRAVAAGEADGAILPAQYARALLLANQGKLVGWSSEIDEPQLGALFVSARTMQARRPTVEKFLRAYRRGTAEYVDALTRRDRYGKRISDAKSLAAASTIARYVYPGHSLNASVATVETGAYFMDQQALIDLADLARQVEWQKAQGLIEPSVEVRSVVDSSFSN